MHIKYLLLGEKKQVLPNLCGAVAGTTLGAPGPSHARAALSCCCLEVLYPSPLDSTNYNIRVTEQGITLIMRLWMYHYKTNRFYQMSPSRAADTE